MKIYSYMDSGRALLATRLTTHTQLLDDDIAYLVTPNPDAMGRGLVTLLQDENLRHKLAEMGRERAQQEFSREAFSRKLSRFYESVEQQLATPK